MEKIKYKLSDDGTLDFEFVCNKCGKCCKMFKDLPKELSDLFNRGDGICKYLDDKTNLCTIYEERPDFCNCHKAYKYVKDKLTPEEYIKLTNNFCKKKNKGE